MLHLCEHRLYSRTGPLRGQSRSWGFEFLNASRLGGRPKHFAVIGGGPGGMEAASRLAEAGNRVVLFEKGDRLGGTLRFASLAYAPNERLLEWLIARVAKTGVEVRLKIVATAESLRVLDPDAVIVATGARRDLPDLPGSNLPHVLSGDDMRSLMLGETSAELERKTGKVTRLVTKVGAMTGATANLGLVRSATHAWMPLGKHVLIVGGELVGVELAEFLCERGRTVTVIEPAPRLGKGLLLVRRMRILAELKEHGVAMHGGVRGISIDKRHVHFFDANGEARSVRADQVIVAMGASGDVSLGDTLRDQGFDVRTVGDCNGVGYIEGAVRGAANVVRGLLGA